MRMNYIAKIQGNLKRYQVLRTNKTTNRVLDGSYKSVFKGRSMNFDELRDYVPGDDIKDMDWKASARSRKLLVRQYVAEKKHNIMLVFDTNRRMLGHSEGLEEKRELALMSAGSFAYMVNGNGDYVSATYAGETSVNHFPFKTGLGNIEMILESVQRSVTMKNTSDLNVALEYILKHFRRKMILVLVTDLEGISKIDEKNLKRLLVNNDMMVLLLSDADLTGKKLYSVADQSYMPAFFARDKKLAKRVKARKEKMTLEANEKLKKYGISCVTVKKTEEIEKNIIDLLNRNGIER